MRPLLEELMWDFGANLKEIRGRDEFTNGYAIEGYAERTIRLLKGWVEKLTEGDSRLVAGARTVEENDPVFSASASLAESSPVGNDELHW